MFIGLFLAPTVVAAAVKTAVLTSAVCQNLGYAVTPRWDEKRTDIIQAITLGDVYKRQLLRGVCGAAGAH